MTSPFFKCHTTLTLITQICGSLRRGKKRTPDVNYMNFEHWHKTFCGEQLLVFTVVKSCSRILVHELESWWIMTRTAQNVTFFGDQIDYLISTKQRCLSGRRKTSKKQLKPSGLPKPLKGHNTNNVFFFLTSAPSLPLCKTNEEVWIVFSTAVFLRPTQPLIDFLKMTHTAWVLIVMSQRCLHIPLSLCCCIHKIEARLQKNKPELIDLPTEIN